LFTLSIESCTSLHSAVGIDFFPSTHHISLSRSKPVRIEFMKRLILPFILFFFSVILLAGPFSVFSGGFFAGEQRKLLDQMSIEEKVGQIFIFGFTGSSPDREFSSWISSGRLGNVKIFSRNVQSQQQLRHLTDSIKFLTADSPRGISPFIATDLEGGNVNHIRSPEIRGFPAAAKLKNPAQGEVTSRQIAQLLQEAGINMNFAPCADVLTNPENKVIGNRSYGSDPQVVYQMAKQFILEHDKAGIVPVVKHFPGHGMTDFDSHLEAKSVETGRNELWKVHLFPYRKLKRDRLLHAVMVAHITYSALDPDNPATFSRRVVEGLLRRKMHFRGITITDDLEMASSEAYAGGIEQAFLRAFEAGNDLFLVAHSKKKQAFLLRQAPELFRSGVLKEKELDQRVLRILRMKKRFLGGLKERIAS
jgi:beta-N-acetylhexosaminidase